MRYLLISAITTTVVFITLMFIPQNKHCIVVDEIPEQVGNTIEIKCDDGSVVWLTKDNK